MSLFAGEEQVPVDISLGHDGGPRPAEGFDPRLVLRLRPPWLGRGRRWSWRTAAIRSSTSCRRCWAPSTPLAYYATGTFEHAASGARVALWRTLVGRADVVAAEGDEVLDQCRSLLRVPVATSVLAPNGRDPDEFHPPARTTPMTTLPAAAGARLRGRSRRGSSPVASLTSCRNCAVGHVVRAFVCGDGPLAVSLSGPAADAGVEMLGSRADVADLLRRADAFVFPSLPTGEGMPGVLIEAGMSGLPVVATAVPGVRTIVEDGTGGFVVDVDDVDAMVEAAATLVAEPALRRAMGEAGRARCVDRFSLEAVAACWLSFLEPPRGARRQRPERAKWARYPARPSGRSSPPRIGGVGQPVRSSDRQPWTCTPRAP